MVHIYRLLLSIAAIAVARSGTLDYTVKLVSNARFIRWLILIDHTSGNTSLQSTNHVLYCKRNSFHTLFTLAGAIRKLGASVVLLQYEYSMLGSPFLTHVLLIILLFLLKIFRIKIVITLHGVLTPTRLNFPKFLNRIIEVFLRSLYTFFVFMAHRIIVLNNLQLKLLTSLVPKSNSKVVVIPHGALLPEEMCVSSSPKRSTYTLFFHGFLRPSKGLDILLEALKILRQEGFNVELRILGSLPYMLLERRGELEYLKTILAKVRETDGVHISVGYLEDTEILAEALASDVIVLPYTDRYYESSGVLHKVMGCGKPVIVTPVPRFLSDLEPWIECFVAAPEPLSLATAVKKLIRDESLSTKLAKAARGKAEKRNWSIISKMYAVVLLELVRESKPS